MDSLLALLKPQAMLSTIQAVAANQPEPARNVLLSTVVIILAAWLVTKIIISLTKK